MSRSHEALKRAEQERAFPIGAGPAISSPETIAAEPAVVIPPSQTAPVPDPLVQTGADAGLRTSDFLRFDDVWNRCSNPGWRMDLERNAFLDPATPPAVREQFRTLRSRLYQVRDKQPLRSVLVTSSLPGEGKTFVANNLAHALSRQQNCRVLLVDADLRRPDLHLGFGAPSSPGLSEYLKGEAPEITIIQRGMPEYLCLITGGAKPDNPAELLAN